MCVYSSIPGLFIYLLEGPVELFQFLFGELSGPAESL